MVQTLYLARTFAVKQSTSSARRCRTLTPFQLRHYRGVAVSFKVRANYAICLIQNRRLWVYVGQFFVSDR